MTTIKTLALWMGIGAAGLGGGCTGDGAGAPDDPEWTEGLGTSQEALALIPASFIIYVPHHGLTATDAQAALDQTAAKVQALNATAAQLKPVATSGAYADLTGKPDLGVYARKAELAPVATSGAYGDLSGAPDLDVFARTADLAAVATSGAYGDLSGTPDLSVYAPAAALAPVATSGAYGDLSGRPDLGGFATTAALAALSQTVGSLAPVATSGAYGDLSGAPDLGVYATKVMLGEYAKTADLGEYAKTADLAGFAKSADLAAVATSGSWNDLADKPDLAQFAITEDLPWQDTGAYVYADIAGDAQSVPDAAFTANNNCSAFAPSIFQSFTAVGDGTLAQASLSNTAAKAGVTFQIRDGVGLGGAVLYQAVIDLDGGANLAPVDGVSLVAGHQYTIVYSTGANSVWNPRCQTGDAYAQGQGGTSGIIPGIDLGFAVFFAGGHPVAIDPDGHVGIGTVAPTASLDVAAGTIRLREPASPASNAACKQGELRWDPSFVYVCVATDTWRRSALAAY